jgi:hypothetical protein
MSQKGLTRHTSNAQGGICPECGDFRDYCLCSIESLWTMARPAHTQTLTPELTKETIPCFKMLPSSSHCS